MANRLHILVGMPGSGKTTLAKNFDLGFIHSTDLIREELSGDVNDMSINKEVFETFHWRIRVALQSGFNIVADSTALTEEARKDLKNIADFVHAETHLIVFTNFLQAFKRNQARERVVPDSVMYKMLAKLEETLKVIPFEGYTSITYIEGTS